MDSTTDDRDWGISEVARLAHTTSRTLRHYGDVGLVTPSRIGDNGYRFYDHAALVRLQRVLMLREMGLGIPAIAELLAERRDDASALEDHLRWLRSEQERIARQLASVQATIERLRADERPGGGEQIMDDDIPRTMFDGFDHTEHRDEVERRWGREAYRDGDAWWSGKTDAEKSGWREAQRALQAAWATAAERGESPHGEAAHALARRQFEALAGIPGTPGFGAGGPTKEYFVGLGRLYVDDPRFAANFGGAENAAFVRDAMAHYAERELS